jgi:hypothetical protein
MLRHFAFVWAIVSLPAFWCPSTGLAEGVEAARTTSSRIAQEAGATPPRDGCPEGEGTPIAGPFGLTLCSDTARIETRALSELQEGVRVASVAPGSAAEVAGFLSGDVMYQIGSERTKIGADAVKRLQGLETGQKTVINFWRNGYTFLIRLRGH